MEKVEQVGLANIFHDNFQCFWWLETSKPSEAIVPEIMETVGFTNNFQDFCYQIHVSGQEAQQKPRSMGGGTIYIYIYVYTYVFFLFISSCHGNLN